MSTGTAAAGAPAVAHRTPAYAWIVLGVLCFIYIFNFLDRQLMSILLDPIKAEMGFDDRQMGVMTGLYFAIFYTGFGVIVGFMADRTSRRNILFAGAFLWSLFTALCGFAHNYPTMLASRVGVGVGEAAGSPVSYSIISDYFPAEKRGLALALFSLGVPFGQALGAGFGAAIHETWGWRTAFIGIGAAGIVASFLLLLIVREPKRGATDVAHASEAPDTSKAGFIPTFWAFMNRPMLLWTALACGMCAFVGYCALGFNVPFLVRVKGINYGEVALYYALMLAVAMGLGTWISGAVVDWLAKRSKVWYALVPLFAIASAIPFWLAYVWAPTWQMAMAFLAVPTFLTIMYLPPALAIVQNSVKAKQRTMSGAILLMVLNLIGLGGGPTMVGALSNNLARSDLTENLGVSADQAGAYLRTPAAELATLPDNVRQAIAAANASGLESAFYWVTPFYFVAVAFLVLMAWAVSRETKEGGPVRDGGFRCGLVILAVGVAGLYLRYQGVGLSGMVLDVGRLSQFGAADLVGQIDTVMDVVTSLVLTVFTLAGLWLVATGLTRKKPAAA